MLGSVLTIRDYQPEHARALMELLHAAVHVSCAADYTPAQLTAWSPPSLLNLESWRTRFERKRPFVAVLDEAPVGFIELEADGHIDCLYVHPRAQRAGVGSRLLQHVVAQAQASSMARVYVEASITALPFFSHHGFSVVRHREVERGGQRLNQFLMERAL